MATVDREISLFIASPGDCPEERARVRDTISRCNSVLAQRGSGLRLRAIGWEEVGPDFGRPQSNINPLVDQCDVFIGVLRRRLGSATGTHESGFVEEFERAVQRRTRSGGEPRIAIYLKDVPPELVDDPGPELQRVLGFRERLVRERMVLFGQFKSADDLAEEVWALLTDLVVSFESSAQDVSNADSGGSKSEAEPVDQRGLPDLDEAQVQMGSALESFADLVQRREPSGEIDQDRLLMIGIAASQDRPPLPVHALNRLYRRRRDLVLSRMEAGAWLRTVLADIGRADPARRTCPGWGVFGTRPLDVGVLESIVVDTLEAGLEGVVARGLARLLAWLGARPDALWAQSDAKDETNQILERWDLLLADTARRDTLSYLEATSTVDDLPLLRALSERLESLDLERLVDLHSGDARPMCLALAGNGSPRATSVTLALNAIDEVAADVLIKLIEQARTATELRTAALRELSRRSAEDLDRAVSLAGDEEIVAMLVDLLDEPELDLTVHAVESHINDDYVTDLARSRLLDRLRAKTRDFDELTRSLGDVDSAYDAWSILQWRSDAQLVPVARRVFDSGGESVTTGLAEQLSSRDDGVVDFVKSRARLGALRVLLSQESIAAEDIGRARQELREGPQLISSDLISIFLPHATAADVEVLKGLLDSVYGEVRERLANELLRLGDSDIARDLLERGRRDEQVAATAALISREGEDEALDLMFSDVDHVRIAAVDEYCHLVGVDGAAQLLDDYPNMRDSYFYNVVVRLDQFVFLDAWHGNYTT